MNEIDIQLAYSKLNVASYALALSLSDIVKNHSDRKDLIESMERHLDGIREGMIIFRELENENRMLKAMNFNFHKENMELKYELDKLKSNEMNIEL